MQTHYRPDGLAWGYGQRLTGNPSSLQAKGVRFAEVVPEQLGKTDLTLFKILEEYKKLLLPALPLKESQNLLDIMAQPDLSVRCKKVDHLLQQKNFPWQKLPQVNRVYLDEPPKVVGLQEYEDYQIFPKDYRGEIILSIQEGTFDHKPFCHFLLYDVPPAKGSTSQLDASNTEDYIELAQLLSKNPKAPVWLHDRSLKENQEAPTTQLYLGFEFDPKKQGHFPKVKEPMVLKVKRNNIWYSTQMPALIQEAKGFLEFLRFVAAVRMAKQNSDAEQFLFPKLYGLPPKPLEKRPVFQYDNKYLQH